MFLFCLTDFAQGLSYKGTQYRQVSLSMFVFFFFFGFAVGASNLKQQVL